MLRTRTWTRARIWSDRGVRRADGVRRSDLERGDLDQIVCEADLQPVDARGQAIERELPRIPDLTLEVAGWPVDDHPCTLAEVGVAGRDLPEHPQPAGDPARADLKVDLDAAHLVHQATMLVEDGAGAQGPTLQSA